MSRFGNLGTFKGTATGGLLNDNAGGNAAAGLPPAGVSIVMEQASDILPTSSVDANFAVGSYVRTVSTFGSIVKHDSTVTFQFVAASVAPGTVSTATFAGGLLIPANGLTGAIRLGVPSGADDFGTVANTNVIINPAGEVVYQAQTEGVGTGTQYVTFHLSYLVA